ncbi:surface-adhesin E family protein [Pseudoxanthomonas suwonensis]|uniref:surface-adhesin E family protein n=1 Tax=Pseudoxanthomonas suwonensis TaxID=314722 RepID=UPI00193E1720|nr:surface-adhesin E family protein [Pseudoxanthomonas suwonensis]
MEAGNDKTLYFFDADTVEKSPGGVSVWVKTVRTRQPDTDGSWATAIRWRINCSGRTIQTLSWSTYNNSGEFIESNNKPSSPSPVTPDTTGEAVLKIACGANFPREANKGYFKLDSNDVFKARDNWVRYQDSQVDTAPK